MSERRDSLMHFLRKQTHAESSNRLVGFSRAVIRYWATLDASGLESYLPANVLSAVRDEREQAAGPNEYFTRLRQVLVREPRERGPKTPASNGTETVEEFIDRVSALSSDRLGRLLVELEGPTDSVRQKVALMVRLHQLLAEKYTLSAGDLAARVERHHSLSSTSRTRFASAYRAWHDLQLCIEERSSSRDTLSSRRDDCIQAALDVLEELKAVVADPALTEGTENIYHKRHIAAGIPSMYGSYTEPKFNATGLVFRVERLLSRLLEDAAAGAVPYVNRTSLRRIAAVLRYFERALALDGLHSQSFSANIGLLDACLARSSVTFHQYRDIFQFLCQSISDLSRWSVLTHDRAVRTILATDTRYLDRAHLEADSLAEAVLREVVVSALGLQTLDRYVGTTLHRITDHAAALERSELDRMMNFDPGRLISWIHQPSDEPDEPITLGYKALGLKQLAASGYRIPTGFVPTTELFGALPAMSCQPLRQESIARIEDAIRGLEERSGLRMGDPERLLTISIRSGAAVSMPGLLMTFTNVGLNDELAEICARKEGMSWTVWDSYRRFLQSWAMSAGIERDVFDEIIQGFKGRYDIKRKSDFTSGQMREIALMYKKRAEELGAIFVEEPAEQIIACIRKVLESWNASQARLYRSHIGVAEDWGTSVIVQRMVLGNLGRDSGSGVAFTRDPQEPHRRRVCLFGDFAVCSQGEDLVGGLVNPLPISEAQRHRSPSYRGVEHSLERDFPQIYSRLLRLGEQLAERDSDPQEIEFTFESASDADLYLLQKRPMVQTLDEQSAVFDVDSVEEVERPVAFGVGVAGGAYAGRIAINPAQIDELNAESPEDSILLLRPDTVPDDIAMIVRVEGILTARGGATSHAAITAKRLGKTAVVDCRALEVLERQGMARLGTEKLHPGDWLSIDGRSGAIYRGRLPVAHPAPNHKGGQR
jgi:pyruvate,orthophosphate dikinase